MKFFKSSPKITATSEPQMNLTATENTQQNEEQRTSEFIRQLKEQPSTNPKPSGQQQLNTDEFIDQLNKELNTADSQDKNDTVFNQIKNENKPELAGGDCNANYNKDPDTDVLINQLYQHVKMTGGRKRKNKVVGFRAIPRFVEGDMMGDADQGAELSRIITNQTTEIINKVIKKIQDIITTNKAAFKKVSEVAASGTEAVARVYKAALWSMVKNDTSKALKSPLDIAVEMEKMVSKEVLLKVDFEEWYKRMEDVLNKKRDDKPKEETRYSATSAEAVDSDISSSETSSE